MLSRSACTVLLAAASVFQVLPADNALLDSTKDAGWRPLFDGKTGDGWRGFKRQTFPTRGWVAEDGWLHCLGRGGGDIITTGEFTDFEFRWQWKMAPGANSGVKYFVTETRNAAIGHEYQLIDDDRHPDAKVAAGKHLTAGVYDVFRPTGARPHPPGQINHSRILVRGNHVEHWLNGAKVLEYECSSDMMRAAVADSKFKNTAGFGEKIEGHILLQEHGSEVWFRNLAIRELRTE